MQDPASYNLDQVMKQINRRKTSRTDRRHERKT